MAAAATGSRAGREMGEQLIAQQRVLRRTQLDMLRKMEADMIKLIMEKYDSDGSGGLSRQELSPMLNDYSKQVFGKESLPSQEDIDFLFALCDRRGGQPDNQIDRKEVLAVTEAWCSFLKQKDHITACLEKWGDKEHGFQLGLEELQGLLEELHSGGKVPSEVTSWVLQEADLTKTGHLTEMELARALCAFEMWQQGKHGKDHNLPLSEGVNFQAAALPPPSAACCAIS
mmetsp:Transcript_18659/g.43375  ORF Transcript_18659/g.43375 Transcript_18659/m.43375 type:complete len:229 (+) Transcript_18659:62-748(+)|eukprot:CAMPEP_0178429984 /NCGR_PEP_ID=MMETSP0689_2-20121128/31085_1 /TAXON_ID=160604 /ORGANISM="Amphidinium massartii, Strain CS-259" /LENGTH=228 /DNA_ID=CAMNT_0020051825 /DNA_START=20 /DNA_END=706 /DNA_ORIENTATION=-